MFTLHNTLYDYRSIITRMGEVVDGSFNDLEAHDLVVFISPYTGAPVIGEVIVQDGHRFTVNNVEIAKRIHGKHIPDVDWFAYLPEPKMFRDDVFEISHKRMPSFIGRNIQAYGADREWYQGELTYAGQVNGTWHAAVDNGKPFALARTISVVVNP
jgi:hypothetical protein